MDQKKRAMLSFFAIGLGFFMALLDMTIVNISMPNMTSHFNVPVEKITWVINGYNLAFAVCLISGARIADQFGRKRIFMLGIFLFTLTSLLCGLSSGSVEMLITFRVLQGMSAAMLVPVTVPIVVQIFPPEKHGAVLGIWGAIAGLASASGPALGGFLTNAFSWPAIFYVNIPIGLLCLILTGWLIEESYDKTASKRIDWLGMLTLSVALFSLILALIQSNDMGWGSAYIVSLFVISAVSLVLFVVTELKVKEPMLPMSLLKILPFNGANITLLVAGIGMVNAYFLLAFFLTDVTGMTELEAGLTISAMPVATIFSSVVAGPLSSKYGTRIFAVLGMACLFVAGFLYSGLGLNSTNFDMMWRLVIGGIGVGLVIGPIMGSVVYHVPQDKVGVVSGVSNMVRSLGMVLGVALLVAILTPNISSGLTEAKAEWINQVEANTVLDASAKDQLTTMIQQRPFASESQVLTAENVLEEVSVSDDAARTEIEEMIPNMVGDFQSSESTAFGDTFKYYSFIILIGVASAFFSDRRREKKAVDQGASAGSE